MVAFYHSVSVPFSILECNGEIRISSSDDLLCNRQLDCSAGRKPTLFSCALYGGVCCPPTLRCILKNFEVMIGSRVKGVGNSSFLL